MIPRTTLRVAAAAGTLAAAAAVAQSDDGSAEGAMPGDAALAAGREVFLNAAEPQCALCHTLAEAGSAGEIGPNLDTLDLDAARVHAAVTGGVGVMPAYDGVLTPEQIDAVAVYVSSVAGTGAAE